MNFKQTIITSDSVTIGIKKYSELSETFQKIVLSNYKSYYLSDAVQTIMEVYKKLCESIETNEISQNKIIFNLEKKELIINDNSTFLLGKLLQFFIKNKSAIEILREQLKLNNGESYLDSLMTTETLNILNEIKFTTNLSSIILFEQSLNNPNINEIKIIRKNEFKQINDLIILSDTAYSFYEINKDKIQKTIYILRDLLCIELNILYLENTTKVIDDNYIINKVQDLYFTNNCIMVNELIKEIPNEIIMKVEENLNQNVSE